MCTFCDIGQCICLSGFTFITNKNYDGGEFLFLTIINNLICAHFQNTHNILYEGEKKFIDIGFGRNGWFPKEMKMITSRTWAKKDGYQLPNACLITKIDRHWDGKYICY